MKMGVVDFMMAPACFSGEGPSLSPERLTNSFNDLRETSFRLFDDAQAVC